MTRSPLSVEPWQVGLKRTLPNPEHVAALTSQDLSHQAAAMAGATNDLPQVAGKPLVLGIQDFRAPGSLTSSSSALSMYLYGTMVTSYKNAEGRLSVGRVPIEMLSASFATEPTMTGIQRRSRPGAFYMKSVTRRRPRRPGDKALISSAT